MSKIKTLVQLAKICQGLRRQDKKIGLITGCFDILHFGHIELFRFAKKHCDVLAVGVDNDKTVRLNKGRARPFFPENIRLKALAELESVDYLFLMKETISFGGRNAEEIHQKILKKLRPNFLFTRPPADVYWKKKKSRCEKLGIKFLPQLLKQRYSSSYIAKILKKEV